MSENLSDIWRLRSRSKIDAERHKQRLRQATKDNLKQIISSEDIISTDSSGKKIKIPMKYLEKWHFRYGNNKKNHGVGHGGKDAKDGDLIFAPSDESNKPGDQKGEIIYEEFALEEVIDMMMEDLNLPWLKEKNQAAEVETETIIYNDISKKGLFPNIDIKRTLKENLKRNAAFGKAKIGKFKQDDLRFKTYNIEKDYKSNASIYMIMDRSGSMTTEKKYIAKSFFFWMVNFIKTKYKNVDLVFIAHDVEAYLCNEQDFFNLSEGGGTKCSSGFEAALTHIKHYHPVDSWNNYIFAFSDGDNYDEDNKRCIDVINELINYVNAIGYGEIILDGMTAFYSGATSATNFSSLHSVLINNIASKKFISHLINKRDDIYDCLKKFFGIRE